MLRSLLTSSRTHLAVVFLLTLCLRVAFWTVPALSDGLKTPYVRIIHYVDAAHNVREGRGLVFDYAKTHTIERDWKASGSRLPRRSYASYPESEAPEYRQFYDEKGYLLLTLALARVTGEVRMGNALLLQSVLSALCAALLYLAAIGLFRDRLLALGVAATYALNPLEIMYSTTPDHPIWPVYAAVVAVFVLSRDWTPIPAPKRVAALLLLGSFLQLCIVQRSTAVAAVAAMAVGCLWNLERIGKLAVAALALGAVITQIGLASVPLEGTTVGRPLVYHTFLAGLSEFGAVEGLAARDDEILRYIRDRYDVEFGTSEFDDAYKIEYQRVVSERPWLHVTVAAKRLAYFVSGYRVGQNSLPVVVAFGLFKIATLIGLVAWWRQARRSHQLPVMLSCLGVMLSSIALHVLIVPLLLVYIAASLILLTPVAAFGALVTCRVAMTRLGLISSGAQPL